MKLLHDQNARKDSPMSCSMICRSFCLETLRVVRSPLVGFDGHDSNTVYLQHALYKNTCMSSICVLVVKSLKVDSIASLWQCFNHSLTLAVYCFNGVL